MKVLILLSVVAAAFALPKEYDCPANSHYDECGTACPDTCDNYKDPPLFCIRMCNPGCHCDKGYVRVKEDVEECLKPEQCPNSANELFVDESACDQPKVIGHCLAAFRRYYFNKESGECEEFIYGGCGANDNNFLTKEECEETCLA
ncbi:thrombin inhibitor hemalin-like [Argiope bruennichi]|uniref:Four-domain proteases inhibitor like protein n=1 Tax=Argiope bruennichi TaxID=94029 RepID=A0A8T0DXM6_ARGBR|nr:thrombin inhibitor hemalin-like [Argiope bruennichi]KAF8763268.1 Four-domain proteases inhibitor like protein [Argiope bruennichi]